MSFFVTFEGPEGSGKTTQIKLLADHLRSQGETVLETREPGGTPIGDAIRAVLLASEYTEMSPKTETLLFNAARAQIVDEVIRPALATGQIVLCDRYADSTLAYQGYGHGQALAPLRVLGQYATGDLQPDLTLYLDIDADSGLQRKRQGDAEEWNRMEEHDLAFHQAVRNGYLTLAAADPARWVVIDATRAPAAIQEEIRAIMAQRR